MSVYKKKPSHNRAVIRWQERHKARGLCVSCNAKRVNATHCERHRIMFNAAYRRRKLLAKTAQEAYS